jgi:2,4-dienoyl-CoA reductase-like NADH-dependent reductase (Old Yellow Enzyme family)
MYIKDNFSSLNEVIEKGEADLISFGVPFLANPDPAKFHKNNKEGV